MDEPKCYQQAADRIMAAIYSEVHWQEAIEYGRARSIRHFITSVVLAVGDRPLDLVALDGAEHENERFELSAVIVAGDLLVEASVSGERHDDEADLAVEARSLWEVEKVGVLARRGPWPSQPLVTLRFRSGETIVVPDGCGYSAAETDARADFAVRVHHHLGSSVTD